MRPRKKDLDLPQCVYRRHGAYWHVKGGKWKRLGKDLHTALIEYAALMEAPKGSMAEFLDRAYIHHLKVRKLSESTREQYAESKATLGRKLAHFAPEDVRSKHVAQVIASLADKPATANAVLSFLRIAMTYAVEWQMIETNPCIGVKRMQVRKRTRYVTDDEFAAIYAKGDARLRVVMDLCYLTGQRIGDVLSIRRADATEDGILFEPRKNENNTQTRMMLAMTPDIRDAIDRAKGLHCVAGMTLLHDRRGRPLKYTTVLLWWRKALKAAGVEHCTPHDLRAKSLTDAKRQGKDAQALGGHANPAMTERYIRLRETPVVSGPSFGQSNRQAKKT